MCVKALVDAWWDGWSWLDRREVKSDLESVRFSRWARGRTSVTWMHPPVARKMAARIQSRDVFLGFQRACAKARLREERARELDKRRGET